MVSTAQSSVTPHRLSRNANNSQIAVNRSAAARFSARDAPHTRSSSAADSGVRDGQCASVISSNRAICSAVGLRSSNIHSTTPDAYDNSPTSRAGQGYPSTAADEGIAMSDHTYRVIEIVGSSPDSIDAAIRNAISRASETMRGLDWFEVQSVRGSLDNSGVGYFQVTLKVGFRLEKAR